MRKRKVEWVMPHNKDCDVTIVKIGNEIRFLPYEYYYDDNAPGDNPQIEIKPGSPAELVDQMDCLLSLDMKMFKKIAARLTK